MKVKSFEAAFWKVQDKGFYLYDIRVAIKDGLPSSMQDELEDNQEEYCFLTRKYWCGLLSTIEFKDDNKRAAPQIKKIVT